MTELLIDGYRVVLPDDFSFTYIEENPFLTKSGEYTLDVNLSLENPTNKRIYKNVHRMNSTSTISNRKAVLIVRGKVLINGIEIVTEITDKSVQIQLVAGNAEMNFKGYDQKIRELDFGTVAYSSGQLYSEIYPTRNFAIQPVACNEIIINSGEWQKNTSNGVYSFKHVGETVPQPYIRYYVDKLFDILGFEIVDNTFLDTDFINRIYLVNEFKSDKFCDFLPDWTVNEFLTELEAFFNVVFVIDKIAKKARVVPTLKYYTENQTTIETIFDEYQCDITKEVSADKIDYSTVEYDLPSQDRYKYLKIDDSILAIATLVEYATYSALKTAVAANQAAHTDKLELFHVTASNRYYVFEKDTTIADGFRLISVHLFRRNGEKSDSPKLLKIVPADIMRIPVDYVEGHMSGYIWIETYRNSLRNGFAPYIPLDTNIQIHSGRTSRNDTAPAPTYDNMVDVIENGIEEKKQSIKDRFFISINGGMDVLRNLDGGAYPGDSRTYDFPISQNDCYYGDLQNAEKTIELLTNWADYTLRLNGTSGLWSKFYQFSSDIDQLRKYLFTFSAKNYIPSNLFIIKNRKFVCEKIEYSIDANGFAPTAKGYFYPVN